MKINEAMRRRSNTEKEVQDEEERRSWNKDGRSRPEGSGTGYDSISLLGMSPRGS